MGKKVLFWVSMGILVYWLISNPAGLADVAKMLGGGLIMLAQAISAFFQHLAS